MPRKGLEILNDGRPCDLDDYCDFKCTSSAGKLNACVQHFFDSLLQYLQKCIPNKIDIYVPLFVAKGFQKAANNLAPI